MQNDMQVDNNTPEGKAKGDKNRQSLIPVTIKQLKNAPANANGEAGFMLDGRELNQITLVGLIIKADEQTTNLMYTVEDVRSPLPGPKRKRPATPSVPPAGSAPARARSCLVSLSRISTAQGTDQIMVKMWVDQESGDEFAERRAQWKEGTVVRVIGQMRAFNNSKSVVAYSIQPITDFNEYTFHFIEVVHTHLRATKGAPPSSVPPAYAGAAIGGAAGASYGAVPAAPRPGAPPAQMYAPQNTGGSLEQLVLTFFATKGEESETGCTIDDVAQALANNGATREQVSSLVENLVGDGHLYSTIDDDHFKATS